MAIKDSLVSVWCEAADPTTDEFGSETLTNNGTVATAAGKIGTAADFGTASTTKYLTHADDAALSTGDIDCEFQAWVYLSSKTKGYPCAIGKVSLDGGTIEYNLLYRSSVDKWEWQFGTAVVRSAAAISINTWYLIHAWHDSVNNLVGISVNAGTPDTAADAGGTDTNKGFAIGTMGDYHDASSTWDGLLNQVAMWKRVLTSGDRSSLYNAGAGLAYASWDAGTGAASHLLGLLGVGG